MLAGNNAMSKSLRYSVLFAAFYWAVLLFIYRDLPFFGDQIALISHPANYIFDNQFSTFIIPENFDTGHPPLLPLLFASIWSVFGQNLAVSHSILFCVSMLAFYLYITICSRWLMPGKSLWLPSVLFLFHPLVITQTLGMSTDMFLLCFFLVGMLGVYNRNKYVFVIACIFLLLNNIRGTMYVAVLGLLKLQSDEGQSLKNILNTAGLIALAAIPFIVWNIYHKIESGWMITHHASPWQNHREATDVNGLWQNFVVYLFRFFEHGFAALLFFFLYFLLRKKYSVNPLLFRALTLSVLFTSMLFIPFQNPILTRYLLIIQVLLLMAFSAMLSYESLAKRVIIIIFILLAFLSAHFYVYPEKLNTSVGYNWDATLAHTKYFSLREEALQFLEQNNMNGYLIGAGFPMYQSFYDTNLEKKWNLQIEKFYPETGRKYNIFIYSNVMNEVPNEVINNIRMYWELVWTKQEGNILMQVYKNPSPL
jgi:hypothetical protein